MPLIHLAITNGQPLVRAFVAVSEPRRAALAAAGVPIPRAVLLTFLIDTGASSTCVDPAAVASLNLQPTGTVQMQTPSTNGVPLVCNAYDISFLLPAPKGIPFSIDALPVIESSLRPQGIDGLLGRDVLAQCALFYNSPFGGFTLAY